MTKNNFRYYLLFVVAFTLQIKKVNAQQINVVDDKGTKSVVNNNQVFRQNTDPNTTTFTPLEGDIWINTNVNPNRTNVWDNGAWIQLINSNSQDWLLTGNAGTNSSTNFLGTTDNQDFVIKRNNDNALVVSNVTPGVQLRLNNAPLTDNHPLVIRANGPDLLAFRKSDGSNAWHWNIFGGGGLNFVESGVADFRIYLRPGGNVGIGTGTPNSKLQINGSVSKPIVFTGPGGTFLLNETHYTVIVNWARILQLPAANTCTGRIYVIKNISGAINAITAFRDETDSEVTSISDHSTITIQSDGTNWQLISRLD